MTKPAARIGDMHVCPMITPGVPPIPHVGGPIIGPGVPTVLIGGMPAAVMGDMCVCVGPPDSVILGSTGVLVGGKPAARMGDMTAHGGSIVVGFPTVLIGEISPGTVVTKTSLTILEQFKPETGGAVQQILSMQQAADTGKAFCEICTLAATTPQNDAVLSEVSSYPDNPTDPCVLLSEIEKDNSKEDSLRLNEEFENAFNENLEDMSPEERAAAEAALQEYQQTYYATDMAGLSTAVYGQGNIPGYERLSDEELMETFGLESSYLDHPESGFKAAIYRSTLGQEPPYTVAYAGTEDGTDWKTNFTQGIGMQSEQHDRAMSIANTMNQELGPDGFSITGHSLGGGLANAANAVTGAQTNTFNAAGVHENTTLESNYGITSASQAENAQNINAYYAENDVLSFAQDNKWKLLAGAAAVLTAVGTGIGSLFGNPGIGAGIGAALGVGLMAFAYFNKSAPVAAGNRTELPEDGFMPSIESHSMNNVNALLEDKMQENIDELKKHFKCKL